MPDHKLIGPICECGDPFCSGCEETWEDTREELDARPAPDDDEDDDWEQPEPEDLEETPYFENADMIAREIESGR
jgi:hypothetical protein